MIIMYIWPAFVMHTEGGGGGGELRDGLGGGGGVETNIRIGRDACRNINCQPTATLSPESTRLVQTLLTRG